MRESSSESDSHRGDSPENKKPEKSEGDGEKATKKPGSKEKGRKRTKTGCLTCRRRRIKCSEERPTCLNCTKSKRPCEGYSQRVVFKDPNTSYRGPPMSSSVPFVESEPFRQEKPLFQQSAPSGPVPLAPKPSASFNINGITHGNTPPFSLPPVTTHGVDGRPYGFVDASGNPLSSNSGPPPTHSYPFNGTSDTVDRSHIPEPVNQPPFQNAPHYVFEIPQSIKEELTIVPPSTPARMNPVEWSAAPSISAPFYNTHSDPSSWPPASASSVSSTGIHSARTPNSSVQFSPWDNGEHQTTLLQPNQYSQYRREQMPSEHHAHQDWYPEEPTSASQVHNNPQGDEDDPLDVSEEEDTKMGEREDDEDSEEDDLDTHLKNNDLGVVVALQARQDTAQPRTFTSFIDQPDMLSHYIPSSRSSPLRDPMTARVFCHFINVTGPAISMFERHTANPSLIFKGEPVPRSQQHIWTYTFPILALHNPGLLHAMCALASLHIAKLQNKPVTPSLKHYAYSLRRVANSLNQPTRRGQPATLAAAMLLAFYEVWCADHQKWTNHLLGARMLVREIDFAGTTKYIKLVKQRQRREEEYARSYQLQSYGKATTNTEIEPSKVVDDVNENIVAILMGKQPRYDEYNQVIDENIQDAGENKVYTERDLEIYETQRDMFWWYCKQDVYQSILGGGKLFMEYDRWSHCPPRAPLGRLNATYGTFDHLVLLMGRLANFAAKDLKRKQLAMRINGGYHAPEGSPPETDHQGSQHQQQQYFPQMPGPPSEIQMPPFSGMMPASVPKLPMGFGSRDQSPQSFHGDDVDPESLTFEAEEEWQDIRHAFSVLEDNFGDDFQALGPEFSPPIETPFGPALQYRTYAIAGIWMNFYMALIVCHRVHPSMPPAAMLASSISARHTINFANEIGRIAAGIAPECTLSAEVSPGVGAALIESGTPIFVAAVQYQNPSQRAWTVNRLRDIARLTGWETALAVTVGLETAWNKAAELGTGPPYIMSEYPDWINNNKVFSPYNKEEGQTNNLDGSLSIINENLENLGMGGEGEDPREGPWMPNGVL